MIIIAGINTNIDAISRRVTTNTNTISTEVTRLEGLITAEATARRTKDSTLEDMIAQEVDTRQRNDNVILNKIPEEATSTNKLADKAYVNAQITAAVPTALSQLSDDTTHRLVTDDEKDT